MTGRPSTQPSQSGQTTPVRVGGRVPVGHVVVSDRWRNSDLVKALQGKKNVLYEDDMGVVDFYPSSDVGVVYITEGEMVAGTTYRRKLVKLRKAEKMRGMVIAEKTSTSGQYYVSLQKFAVLDLGLVLLPVNSQTEAAGLLAELVNVENRPMLNQFRVKRKQDSLDHASLLTSVQTIPGLGATKAKTLLGKFKTLEAICNASEEELAAVVGRGCSSQIRRFFWGQVT